MSKTLKQYIKESIDIENVIYLMDKYINNDVSTSDAINELITFYTSNKSTKDELGKFLYNTCAWDKSRILEFINFFNNDATGMAGIDNPNNLPHFYNTDLSDEKDLQEFFTWTTSQLKNILNAIVNNGTYIKRKMKSDEMSKDLLEAKSNYYNHETIWQKIKKWFGKLFNIDVNSMPKKDYRFRRLGYMGGVRDDIEAGKDAALKRKAKDNTDTNVDSLDKDSLKAYSLSRFRMYNYLPKILPYFPNIDKLINSKEFNNEYDDHDNVFIFAHTNLNNETDKDYYEGIDIITLDSNKNVVNLIAIDANNKITNIDDVITFIINELAAVTKRTKNYIDQKRGLNFTKLEVKIRPYNQFMEKYIGYYNKKAQGEKFEKEKNDKETIWTLKIYK